MPPSLLGGLLWNLAGLSHMERSLVLTQSLLDQYYDDFEPGRHVNRWGRPRPQHPAHWGVALVDDSSLEGQGPQTGGLSLVSRTRRARSSETIP